MSSLGSPRALVSKVSPFTPSPSKRWLASGRGTSAPNLLLGDQQLKVPRGSSRWQDDCVEFPRLGPTACAFLWVVFVLELEQLLTCVCRSPVLRIRRPSRTRSWLKDMRTPSPELRRYWPSGRTESFPYPGTPALGYPGWGLQARISAARAAPCWP